ncbi:MAG: replication-associated recombination protein A [Syntrophales bacterium]|jgi:putative ATPase|nr:replication-associated recombination protein A [Syntrophales bacterium]NLN60355.1 replication-associated recombination protein A [Deltaproteobacteria bacterium]
MDLFEGVGETRKDGKERPLAERMRPRSLQEYIGQGHLVGDGSLLRRAVEEDSLFSMIFWGPPGSGKTTLSILIAGESKAHFIRFSAVLSGVKEIRAVVEEAQNQLAYHGRRTILFVDEIHRFNKAQQDAFLPHVENGLITLIGATTENPSFEIIAPLLSRCRVMVLKPFSHEELRLILDRALRDRERGLGNRSLHIEEGVLDFILSRCDGDARSALNNLEAVTLAADSASDGMASLTLETAARHLDRKTFLYDKAGEEHYNLISAFHKSLRGSDPDASLYWLGRMLAAGEDPLFIARRMVRMAAEDIGNADPNALALAVSAMQGFQLIGSPEGELILAQAAVYLAAAPKSNALYTAYGEIQETISRTGSLPVPLHIRNAPTGLMRDLEYGRGYKYAHDYKGGVVPQDYLPELLLGTKFYKPTDRGYEKIIRDRLRDWWNSGL